MSTPSTAVVVTPQPGYDPGGSLPQAAQPELPPAERSTIDALLIKAEKQAAKGHYEAAAGSLERAIRITPNDAELWYELARIRLRQGEIVEAEDLAVKSRTMAIGLPGLQARNWRLVAVVRQQAGDNGGAEQALENARELESGMR